MSDKDVGTEDDALAALIATGACAYGWEDDEDDGSGGGDVGVDLRGVGCDVGDDSR